jgi:hypothetical protein
MKKYVSMAYLVGSLLLIILIFASPLSAVEKFRARYITLGGPIREKAITINITVDSYTTPEEVTEMQQILRQKGSLEFVDAFRGFNKGVINFKSARGLNMRINAAHTYETDTGKRIIVFTERQAWDTDSEIRITGTFMFMAIELELDERGAGKGKFYPGVNIKLENDGYVVIDTFQAPKLLMGAKQTK